MDHAIAAPTRPDHFANRDFTPLVMAPPARLLHRRVTGG